MLEGFLFYYNFVSADSCGFARRGGTLWLRAFLRGGEAFIVAKAISPPRAPPLRPRGTGCCPRCGQSACCGQAAVGSRFRRAFAEGEQLVSLPSSTEVLHATAKRTQRRGFLGGACGLRNFELAPPKGFLSLQTETKLQLKSTIKNILQSSYIKNDNPH